MSDPANPQPEASRPHMPGNGREGATGRPGERFPWSRAARLLESARNYWVCTTRPDGRPHAVPVWGIWLDGTFYFSTGRQSRKARNLAANPHVAVHLESGSEAVIVEGGAGGGTDPAPPAPFRG